MLAYCSFSLLESNAAAFGTTGSFMAAGRIVYVDALGAVVKVCCLSILDIMKMYV
jgi:hypothetical protein